METKTTYYFNKEKFLNYITNNFNIEKTSYLLIDNIIDYLQENNNYTMTSKQINYSFSYEIFYYQIFIDDLIKILNNSNIDISITELIINKILDKKTEV